MCQPPTVRAPMGEPEYFRYAVALIAAARIPEASSIADEKGRQDPRDAWAVLLRMKVLAATSARPPSPSETNVAPTVPSRPHRPETATSTTTQSTPQQPMG